METEMAGGLGVGASTGSINALATASTDAATAIELVGTAADTAAPLVDALAVSEGRSLEQATLLAEATAELAVSIELAGVSAGSATPLFEAMAAAMATAAGAAADLATAMNTALSSNLASSGAAGILAAVAAASDAAMTNIELVGVAAAEATPLIEAFAVAEGAASDSAASLATTLEAVGVAIELTAEVAAQAATIFDGLAAAAATAATTAGAAAAAAATGAATTGGAQFGGKIVSATAVKNMAAIGTASTTAATALDAVAVSAGVAAAAFNAVGTAAGAAAVAVNSLASAIGAVAVALQAMAAAAAAANAANAANTQGANAGAVAVARQAAAIAGVNSQLTRFAAFAGKTLLPIALIVGAIAVSHAAVDLAADLERLSQRTGISVHDLSALNVAAKEAGFNVEALGMMFRRLDTNIDQALHGNATTIRNFKELLKIGSTDDLMKWLNTTAPIDKLKEIATAMDAIPNAEERIAKAQELIGGRGGSSGSTGAGNLLFFLHQLAGDGFAKVTEEAHRLGMVIDEDTGQKAVKFQQDWERMKLSLEGVGVSLLGVVLPAMDSLTQALTISDADPWTKWLNPLNLVALAIKSIASGLASILGSAAHVGQSFGVLIERAANVFNTSGHASDMLTSTTLAKVKAGKTKSHPGALGSFSSWLGDEEYRQDSKDADLVGSIWGIGVSPDTTPAHTPPHDPTGGVDKSKEALQLAKDQLAVAQERARAEQAGDNITKMRLEHEAKLLDIQRQMDQHVRSIPKETESQVASQLIATFRQTAAAQKAAEEASFGTELDATLRRMREQTRELGAQLDIQRMQIGSEGAIADNVKQQIGYAVKLAQIEDERQKNIADIDPKDPMKRQRAAVYNDQAAAKQLEAVLSNQAAVEATARAQQEEMRSLTTSADEAERAARAAKMSADLEMLRRDAIQTAADVQHAANDARLLAEQDFESRRVQLSEAAAKAIASQQVIIEESRRRLAGNVDGVTGSQEDFNAIAQAVARIQQIQRAANAQIIADRTKTDAQVANITIQQEIDTQVAINALRGDATAAEMAARINALEKMGTWEAYQHSLVIKAELKQYLDMIDLVRAHWRAVAEEVAQSFANVFDTLMKGGKFADALRNIGSGFQKLFTDDIGAWLKQWMSKITNAAAGVDANGNQLQIVGNDVMGPLGAGQMWAGDQQRARRMQGAAQVVGAGLSGYSAGQGGGAATASAIAAFASGMMTGNPMIAVAATIASLIGSAISGAQKRADYQYGSPYFSYGDAAIATPRNLTDPKIVELTASLQKAFNEAFNSMQNVILKITGGNFGGLAKSEIVTPPMTLNGKFQDNPSAHWAEHFQTYLSDTLPRDVAKLFYEGMKTAFTNAMGMLVQGPVTADVQRLLGTQFDRFWQEADKLDAQGRQQFWNDLADGLVAFTNAATKYAGVVRGMKNSLIDVQLDANGTQHQYGDSDFVTTLKAGTQGLFDQARAMVSLTGPDRIAAFKALGQSVDKVTDSLVAYINHIADVLRQVAANFHDAFYQHDLSRAGDVTDANGNVIHKADKNEQARLMEGEYNATVDRIQHAKSLGLTADEVSSLTNKAIDLLNSIYALDPTAAADEWWRKQMGILQTISTNSLNELGQAARDAVSRLIAEVQPFVDWFNGLPVDLDAAMKLLTGPDGAFAGFADALDALTQKIKNTPTQNGGGNGNDGQPDKPIQGGGGDNHKVNSVGGGNYSAASLGSSEPGGGAAGDSYYFTFGNVYGVDDLQAQIKSAIRSVAKQGNPSLLRRDYS